MQTLSAWNPWHESLQGYHILEQLISMNSLENWNVYWRDTVSILVTVNECLKIKDKLKGHIHRQIIADFFNQREKNRKEHNIYYEFIKKERNQIHHEFRSEAFTSHHTHCSYLDKNLNYHDLCNKYGEHVTIDWSVPGQSGLDLLRIGLSWWEEKLRVIEIAIVSNELRPFSSAYSIYRELLSKSLAEENAIVIR